MGHHCPLAVKASNQVSLKKKIVRRIFLFGFCFFGVLGFFFVAVPVLFCFFFFYCLGFFVLVFNSAVSELTHSVFQVSHGDLTEV